MIWFTQCRFCQFMVLCNGISDRSILYQKRFSEIHNKLNCVRWEVDTPEKMRNQSWQKNEVEYNCCLTIDVNRSFDKDVSGKRFSHFRLRRP